MFHCIERHQRSGHTLLRPGWASTSNKVQISGSTWLSPPSTCLL
eukprot:06317.XXX_109745_109876_1 [CDS] Oithona nana genome sequencing.